MQRFTIRLIVALLAFGVGVGATAIWIAYSTPEVQTLEAPCIKEPTTLVTGPCASLIAGPCVSVAGPIPPGRLLGPVPGLCGYASSEAMNDISIRPPVGPISGGVLNGKAVSKPAPPYPSIAKAARASGVVTVQVVVDEAGRVMSAKAVSGHPLLQAAAVQAAYQARFTPTLLSGQPVKVSGIVTYNFVIQ